MMNPILPCLPSLPPREADRGAAELNSPGGKGGYPCHCRGTQWPPHLWYPR